MKICLFGVSNVGKTTVGKLLAERLDIKFVDLDEEVKNRLKISLEEFLTLRIYGGEIRNEEVLSRRLLKWKKMLSLQFHPFLILKTLEQALYQMIIY